MEHLVSCTQQTTLLREQALNAMMYHRRNKALSSIMSCTECKAILKEKSELLCSDGYLFEKEFETCVSENKRAKCK